MKHIKLFENLNECILTKEQVREYVDNYIKDYERYFGDAISHYEEQYEEEVSTDTPVDIIELMYTDDITISIDEDRVRNGFEDLVDEIKGLIPARQIAREVLKEILKREAENDIDNYLKHKSLYKSLEVVLPENLKRADDSGLLDMKK